MLCCLYAILYSKRVVRVFLLALPALEALLIEPGRRPITSSNAPLLCEHSTGRGSEVDGSMRLIERHRTTHLQLDGSAFRVLAWCTTCERDLSREFLKSDPPRARPHATLLSQKLGYHCTHTDEGLHAQR